MSQLTDRLESDLREIAAGAHPSPSAWESIAARLGDDRESEVALVLAPAPDRAKRPVWIAAAAAALIVITGSIAVLVAGDGDDQSISTADPDATNPSGPPTSTVTEVAPTIPPTAAPFVGIWLSTDTDGSSQTMEIVRSPTDEYGVVLHDDAAIGACSGAPATMTGTGLLETDERLVIAQPELTCDDGAIPRIGPPPQADLANFTLTLDPATDEFVDHFGIVWRRAGLNDEPIAPAPVTVPPLASANDESDVPWQGSVPALASATSGGMWPQSTLDEARAAQVLADAGDPAYTWQLDANLAAGGEPWGAGILTRLIEEGLGWDEYISGASFSGFAGGEGGQYEAVLFLRCAPGQTNPLSPLYAQAPFEIRGCAPTIDDLTYETVSLSVSQPGSRGSSGIWVVNKWEILQSKYDPGSLFGLLYPDYFSEIQVEQVAPPSDAEVTALLQAFLEARVDGEGAEEYLLREPDGSWAANTEVPLLYATTSGGPYERSEIELVQGPVWPNGWTEYKVRLFAEDETVVEQYFHVVRYDDQFGLVYGYASTGVPTTENGQPVAVPHKVLGDTLTVTAPPLVPRGDGRIEIALTASRDGRVIIAEDPQPDDLVRQDCRTDTAPTRAVDATALARSIEADPNFETTETVPVSIAGIDGLQIDVTFSDPDLCYSLWSPDQIPPNNPGWRMRLYLVDYPESAWPSNSNWRPQVLTIAVIAPEADFERALEEATPIVESIEFLVP